MPVFPCEDSAGNEAKIPLASDGGVAVSSGAVGTKKRDSAVVTPGALNTDVTVSVITLVAGEKYVARLVRGSNLQPTEWRYEHDDNGTPDRLDGAVRGVGFNEFGSLEGQECIEFTAGGAGVQEVKLIGQQLRGPLSDMHGSQAILELA